VLKYLFDLFILIAFYEPPRAVVPVKFFADLYIIYTFFYFVKRKFQKTQKFLYYLRLSLFFF